MIQVNDKVVIVEMLKAFVTFFFARIATCRYFLSYILISLVLTIEHN